MTLLKIGLEFSVCKIRDVKDIDFTKDFTFLSKTDDEISLVCESQYVPESAVAVEADWRALKIEGVLDFRMVGVIAKMSNILTEAGISIFIVSTYNTDYIFLKSYIYEKSVTLLTDNGYTVR